MAARRADERRTRPIIRALEAGCGWLEEPVPLSVGREGAWPGGAGPGAGPGGALPGRAPQRSPLGLGLVPFRSGTRLSCAREWPRPGRERIGWGCRPSFHGWRLRRGDGNWDEVGAEAEAVGVRVRDKRTEAGRGAERARELRNGETQREKYM